MKEKNMIAVDEHNEPLADNTQSPKSILVVEDDRTHRSLMTKILEECEFEVTQAENGVIALSKIEPGHFFDLIVLDWDMPEMDGLETVRAIRAREVEQAKPHIPVVCFTAHHEPGDREQCLAAGMDAYLPKDVWMPKWRQTLIDNLQGLIAGDFEFADYEGYEPMQAVKTHIDLDAFDMEAFNQTATLLKDELAIAIDEYLEDASSYIREIEDGMMQREMHRIARGSHPLKSNSKGFGLMAVSKLAEMINHASEKDDELNEEEVLEIVGDFFPQLREAFTRAEKRLKNELSLRR